MPPRHHVGFIAGLLLFGAIALLPPPGTMSLTAWRVVAVAVLMATWWVSEALPIVVTALLPLVLFPLLGIATIDASARPYANPVIFLFMGGFLIAAGWQRTGLHLRMALRIVQVGGMGRRRLIGSFMLATAFISMWVSNTATTAMLLPMAVSVIDLSASEASSSESDFASALLLGVAYAASIGGIGTLIGTPPNALLAGFMQETHSRTIGFGEWMLVGVPLVVISLPICWFILTRVAFRVRESELTGGSSLLRQRLLGMGPMKRAEWLVAGTTAIVATLWMLRPLIEPLVPALSDAGIAIAGAIALFMLPRGNGRRILDEAAVQELPWPVLILFGGGLALADGIQSSGLAAWIGTSVTVVGTWPLVLTVAILTTVVIFVSELASNTATAAGFLPVATAIAVAMGVDPIMLAVPTTLAATCAFMMPVGTPPNAMVFATGRIPLPKMLRAGWWLNVTMIVLITAVTMVLVPIMTSR